MAAVYVVLLFANCIMFCPAVATEFTVQAPIEPGYDGMKPFAAANKRGGVYGRPLVFVECNEGFAGKHVIPCAKNFSLDYPTMIAWTGLAPKCHWSFVLDEFRRQNLFFFNPTITDNLVVTDWIFTTTYVQKYHIKRVAFVTGEDMKFETAAAEMLFIAAHRINGVTAYDKLDHSTVDPALLLAVPELFIPELAFSSRRSAGLTNTPCGKLFIDHKNPILTDRDYLAMRRVTEDLANYNGSSLLLTGTNVTMGFMGWITGQLIPITVIPFVLDSTTFLFGPFSDAPCNDINSGGIPPKTCQVNVGARVLCVLTIGDVIPLSTSLHDSPLTVIFASSIFPHRSKRIHPSFLLSVEMMVSICVGLVSIALLIAVMLKLARGHRIHRLFRSDVFMLLLTVLRHLAHIGVNSLSAIVVAHSSKSIAFTGVFLFLTVLGMLACVADAINTFRFFLAIVNVEGQLTDEERLLWQVQIGQTSLLTLALHDIPMIVIVFIALLRLRVNTTTVLISFLFSCYNFGTKFRFLKEVFTAAAKIIGAQQKSHRISSLKCVMMRFFIGVSRLAKHPSMTISDLHLSKTPSPSQMKSQRDILETNEPTRCLNLQFCARRIIAELRLHKTSEEEFFAVILPRLSERYDSIGGDVKSVSKSYCAAADQLAESTEAEPGVAMSPAEAEEPVSMYLASFAVDNDESLEVAYT